MTAESPNQPFHLVRTPDATASLVLLGNGAKRIGILPAILATLRTIERNLTTIPREWGDPFQQLPGLKMVVYRRIIEQLLVVYAVHEREPLVWLQTVAPVLNHPLAGI